MNFIGYARTTINECDLDTQLSLLSTYGCDKIYQDTFKPAENNVNCSLLDSIVDDLKEDDTLVICRLNHLGKSTRQLTEFAHFFKKNHIHLVSLEEKIDTRGPEGPIYFKLMQGLAKMECELIKERTLIGLTNARKRGKIGGRPKIDMKVVHKIRQMYYDNHENVQVIASKCQVSIGTCYKYINLTEADIQQMNN
ncbi:recombinase family protein [Enterococcus sp. BWB1-3]|uniref:recombinase family protein n=1 Tax=unclassified Enterococcus TaxID=2608891 RepID=UPI001920FE1C|nr:MULTISPECIES: recombinase family protein [unclassified Enterococcus]MBL1230276.1 recombinase family protein [Enterococcus sp. BWB1-3]MCB5951683.1 recombinase family protein [Enterococcus sp. BWT-B8]MCB5954775.1 recombinase family protein [Enterococcus sp. CWB-B31]